MTSDAIEGPGVMSGGQRYSRSFALSVFLYCIQPVLMDL